MCDATYARKIARKKRKSFLERENVAKGKKKGKKTHFNIVKSFLEIQKNILNFQTRLGQKGTLKHTIDQPLVTKRGKSEVARP